MHNLLHLASWYHIMCEARDKYRRQKRGTSRESYSHINEV